ncbi:hypothetical protein ACP275_09G050000 [Erythranthe tilingii]
MLDTHIVPVQGLRRAIPPFEIEPDYMDSYIDHTHQFVHNLALNADAAQMIEQMPSPLPDLHDMVRMMWSVVNAGYEDQMYTIFIEIQLELRARMWLHAHYLQLDNVPELQAEVDVPESSHRRGRRGGRRGQFRVTSG